MMDETSSRIAELLKRTEELEAKLSSGHSICKTTEDPSSPGLKRSKPNAEKFVKTGSPTPNKLKLKKVNNKVVYRENKKKKPFKNDKLFEHLLSSEDESCSEISSICGSCDSSAVNTEKEFPDSSISVAYSMNHASKGHQGVGKSEESMELELEVARQALLSNSEISGNSSVLALAGMIDPCSDSQKSFVSETTNNDLIAEESSIGSRNISDFLRDVAEVKVVPDSQNLNNDSFDVSKEMTESKLCGLSPLPSEDSNLHLSIQGGLEKNNDLEKSVLVLSQRLDDLLTKRQVSVKKNKRSRMKQISGSSTGSTDIPAAIPEEDCMEINVDASINSSCHKNMKSVNPNKKSKRKDKTKPKRNIFCQSVTFSSEEEEELGRCLQEATPNKHTIKASPLVLSNGKVKVAPKGTKVAPSKILQAVDFSSEDEITSKQSTSTRSDSVESPLSRASGSSNNPGDEDIAQLSLRLDSILLGKVNKLSTKKSKKVLSNPRKSKKNAKLILPDFSSEEEVFIDRGEEPPNCNVSLQVSLSSQGSSVSRTNSECTDASNLEVTNKSLQVSFVSSVSSNRSPTHCSDKGSPEISPCSDNSDISANHTSDKCHQISIASDSSTSHCTLPGDLTSKSLQVSLPSLDEDKSPEIHEKTVNSSPDVCSISLQVSLPSELESPIQEGEHSSSSDKENGESPTGQDENIMYKTALMEPCSPEDQMYKTVAEFASFEDDATSPSVALFAKGATCDKRKSRSVLLDISKEMSHDGHWRETEDYFVVSESGDNQSDLSDKENHQPPSASCSDEENDKSCCKPISSKVEEDYFVVSEVDSPRNDELIKSRQAIPARSKAIHKITFSSDEDVKPLAESESESDESSAKMSGGARAKYRFKQKVLSPVKTAIGPDQMYEDQVVDENRRKHRTPRPARNNLSESSSDDDLDAFLARVNEPQKVKDKPLPSLDDFIVDDDIMTSDEEGDNPDDHSVFYIRTDRDLDYKSSRTRQLRTKTRSPLLRTPEITDDESDDEDDVIVVKDTKFKTPVAPPVKPKSQTCKPVIGARQSSLFSTPVSHKTQAACRTPLSPLDRHAPTYDRPNSTGHTPHTCGFLKSLSTDVPERKRHIDAGRFIKSFKKLKEELTAKLFTMYNETVFENKLPEDLPIQWNTRMTKTAGYCTYKKYVSRDVQRTARVELSVKVCDSAERVRDTLIHELCHAAVWLFYGKTDGHGHHWKHWARKANLIHPDLPIISRCHSYDIQTKYTYQCTKCGYKIGRHSKSLDTEKKVCGYCMGTFQLVNNNTRSGTSTPQTPRTPNRFALFVKENYGSIKKQHQNLSHKDVMQKLSADFALKSKIN